ncbi:MAG: glycolate oxidase subunit GlcF [Rhodobiaceae bacterium]|nr:glycolate oxidase subunit GlcF [Rhodobiaceae bacterium]
MQTSFTPEQLRDPAMQASEAILRTCVHCGFCTATCPTYVLLGDELDSPRGRIYQIKDMFENDRPATDDVVRHVDRCLSCLSCMTTCPSGVHYMHLVDHARAHIEKTYDRGFADQLMRNILAAVLPYPNRFRLSLVGALFGKPLAPLLRGIPGIGPRLAAMLALAPSRAAPRSPVEGPRTIPAKGERTARVAILSGCAQRVLQPETNAATIELLTRMGVEVVLPEGEGCCGALVHHMGREEASHEQARRNIDAWTREIDRDGLDAIIITASGCGTTVKDYGFMFRTEAAYAEKAERVSALTKDITEFLDTMAMPEPVIETDAVVAYHSACSMQHGQQIKTTPQKLLKRAGFRVKDVPEGHLCCGSAGVYNIMQPEIAGRLKQRKIANIESTRPDLIAAGNIGCITQIGSGTDLPILHTVELLNWVTGGARPSALEGHMLPGERPANPYLAAAE